MDSLRQCDSYAKMNNKAFYGLSTNKEENECNCDTFDSMPGELYTDTIVTIETKYKNISYLGNLENGGLFTLEKEDYSENFDKLYNVENTGINGSGGERIKTLLQPPNNKTLCNPFSGSGLNRLTINKSTDLGYLKCNIK